MSRHREKALSKKGPGQVGITGEDAKPRKCMASDRTRVLPLELEERFGTSRHFGGGGGIYFFARLENDVIAEPSVGRVQTRVLVCADSLLYRYDQDAALPLFQ